MCYILSIETSSKNCSVALSHQGQLIQCLEEVSQEYIHAERLHTLIEQLMQNNQLSLSSLQAIAISKGPGSYTGLRIGVSAAKGLCFALNIPLIAIDTTELLAFHARQIAAQSCYYLPMIDARRMEVYCALYNQALEVIEPVHAQIIESNFFDQQKESPLVVVGDGVAKCSSFIPQSVQQIHTLPSAAMMTVLAQQQYDNQSFVSVAYFEPFYLKEFIAGTPKQKLWT